MSSYIHDRTHRASAVSTSKECQYIILQWRTKILGTGYGKPSFHILNLSNVQMQHNVHFSNHLETATGPPLTPPNNVGMKKHCQDRVKCTGVHKLQHCLGERGKGGKIKADSFNCPKNFVLHCSIPNILHLGRAGFSSLRDQGDVRRCRATGYVGLCRALQGCVWPYSARQGYVGLGRAMQGQVSLCTSMQGYVGLCRAKQGFV